MHLALDPKAEFLFLSSVVKDLKNTQKFRMNFIFPNDNHILARVCHGIPFGKHCNEVNKVMAELIKYAERHHAQLLKDGLAITMFKPPGSRATRFEATGELLVVGNSQARKFA